MTIASETRALAELRRKLGELFALQERGGGGALAEARGFVDGYMSGLIDSGVATSQELLEMVAAERRRRRGPGSAPWNVEPVDAASERASVRTAASGG